MLAVLSMLPKMNPIQWLRVSVAHIAEKSNKWLRVSGHIAENPIK